MNRTVHLMVNQVTAGSDIEKHSSITWFSIQASWLLLAGIWSSRDTKINPSQQMALMHGVGWTKPLCRQKQMQTQTLHLPNGPQEQDSPDTLLSEMD